MIAHFDSHPMLLDRESDAPIPSGYTLISSEVEFLLHAIDSATPLHVRGVPLCRWAESFFAARSIPYREAQSPTRELLAVCPRLTVETAQALYNDLSSIFEHLKRPLTVVKLLNVLHPHRLWAGYPSREHAAEWLLWLYEHRPELWVVPLLETICEQWQSQVSVAEQPIYRAQNADAAQKLLDSWLGITDEPFVAKYREFPFDVPLSLQNRAHSMWKRKMSTSSGDAFTLLAARELPDSMKQLAAREALDYYHVRPEDLTSEKLEELQLFLSPSEVTKLRGLLRPTLPGPMPTNVADLVSWFRDQYLPFRLWQASFGSEAHLGNVQEFANQFALWYLNQYPAALNGGELQPYLSFVRSANLPKSDPTATTLLIILDGLHLADARRFKLALENRSSRLTLISNELIFAPLPTITEFCKEALLHGVQPNQVELVEPLGEDILPERESPVNRLRNAKPGKLYIWRILEPDKTYHQRNNYDTLSRAVEGVLDVVAANIADVVNQVPDAIRLNIVIATDHGRLLARSARTQPAPFGMQVHGRTAWGNTGRIFPDSGYQIVDNLVYLHPDRFGLSQETAIVLDESAFLTIDGKSGSELYPHGGLFPEEVIVPWIVYGRDVVEPEIDLLASGRNQAGQRGTLSLQVVSASDVQVLLQTLRMIVNSVERETVQLGYSIQPRAHSNVSVELGAWPSSTEIKSLKAVVKARLSNGLVFDIPVAIELQSDEMYQQDDILGDLGL